MLRIALLGGFLGAGKTTTMVAVARRLEAAGERVAIITNDQGADLVDTDLARNTTSAAVAEVTGGCFCCRFDDLAATITRVRGETNPSIVLAEAVGSCTDLQSTVVRPLRHLQDADVTVAPLVVVLDPLRYQGMCRQWLPLADEANLAYLYRHQLDEADIIAVNKTDLRADTEVTRLRVEIGERYPGAAVVAISAATRAGFDTLIPLWMRGNSRARRPFEIDYDRYAEAEASLAWANRTFTLCAHADAPLNPPVWADRMLAEFTRASGGSVASIGHVKVLAQTGAGMTKASLTGAGAPTFDCRQQDTAAEVTVTVNARVQTAPEDLDALLDHSIGAANAACSAGIQGGSASAFRPGYPVPVHRMLRNGPPRACGRRPGRRQPLPPKDGASNDHLLSR